MKGRTMTEVWPWVALAGAGALHGLSPTGGWPLLAAWGVRAGDRSLALRGLLPIALGHAASVGLVAAIVALGFAPDHGLMQVAGGALFLMLLLLHLTRHARTALRAPTGHAGLACWSFGMASAHGSGLVLVPALVPLCTGATADGSVLGLALGGVLVHLAAMLTATGVMAGAVSWGWTVRRQSPTACEHPRSAR